MASIFRNIYVLLMCVLLVLISPVFAGFPLSCHWIESRSANNDLITIEDGSTWQVAAGDRYVVNSWRTDDPIFITPITSWFISQHYYISNRVNNTYIKADLVDRPIAYGPHSHWVTGIDIVQGHVYLENQSVWCIDPHDAYILSDRRNNNDWALNDHVIILLHDDRYSSYDHVLINVNMSNQVHAKRY